MKGAGSRTARWGENAGGNGWKRVRAGVESRRDRVETGVGGCGQLRSGGRRGPAEGLQRDGNGHPRLGKLRIAFCDRPESLSILRLARAGAPPLRAACLAARG